MDLKKHMKLNTDLNIACFPLFSTQSQHHSPMIKRL